MPSIAKIGSVDSGHAPFAPSVSISGQSLFLVNGVPAMATGDAILPHVAPLLPPHPGTAIGSSKLIINGKPAVMVGDAVSCGSVIVSGDPTMQIT